MRTSVIAVLALLLSACTVIHESSAPTETVTAHTVVTVTAAPSPSPLVPADVVAVTSTASCVTLDPVGLKDFGTSDGYIMTTKFRCTTTSSDPRTVGVEEFTMVATIANPAVGGACTIDDAVLETDEGKWTGAGECVVDLAGILSPAKYVEPTYFGHVHYAGTGAYEGLVYNLHLYGMQGEIAHAGWIGQAG